MVGLSWPPKLPCGMWGADFSCIAGFKFPWKHVARAVLPNIQMSEWGFVWLPKRWGHHGETKKIWTEILARVLFRPHEFLFLSMIGFIRYHRNMFYTLKSMQCEIQWSRKYWKERLEDYVHCINSSNNHHRHSHNSNHLVVTDARTVENSNLSLQTFL